jgi:hypothetical protein
MIGERLLRRRRGDRVWSITKIAVWRVNCQASQHCAQQPCDSADSRCDGTIHASNDKTPWARLPAVPFIVDYAMILSPWLGGWLVTSIRTELGPRFIA